MSKKVNGLDAAKAAVKIRREQLAFDQLPEKEKADRRRSGLDPYEPEDVRKKKQAACKRRWMKQFDGLPVEARQALTELGVSPYQDKETVIRREFGFIRAV